MSDPIKPTVSKLSVIFAGEDLTATLLDNSSTAVRVRAMPVRHLGRLLQLADYEADLLEFVCLIPAPAESQDKFEFLGWQRVSGEWVDSLTPASHEALYEAAKQLNFSRAASWAERQLAAKKFTGDIAIKTEELMTPIIQKLAALLASSSKLPESRVAALPKS